MSRPRRSAVAALLALLLLPACQQERWTDAQQTEAVRMCRGQFGFPGISVFESQEVTYVRFMCRCEVDWLAERIPHRTFEDRLKASEVSRLLAAGGVSCLQRLKEQSR